ncbi:MAG: NAD(P)H-dependent oxidoreductase, partial [Ilumatobacteraceae bacterium]|nr:NAD(P)H-dependent oxidoreductase [Ilumatobacteraceae bacterium]
MKILLVFAHPNPASFSGALRDIVLSCAEKTSCELRQHDLYDTGFSAAVSANEWALHRSPPDTKQHLAEYFADLQW